MKKLIIPFILFTLMVSAQSGAQVTLIWENDSISRTPESVVYDNIRKCCYFSNFNRSPKNGMTYNEDYVSKINLKGELLERKMVSNLTSPTGLCLFKNKLYIVERFGIVKYDLKQDKVDTRYRINTTKFLNDVAVDSSENIYVTVSDTNIIYRIKETEVQKWLESDQIFNPNGIIFDGDRIIVGVCRDNTLKSITITDKKISTIATLGTEPGVIDGIKKYGDDYFVGHYEGLIYLVHKNGEFTEVLNTKKNGIYCADFEYINDQQLFVIPALYNNKILLYKYEPDKKSNQH
jgi:sugar lactone lactonase YvrE